MSWSLEGTYAENCNCDVMCPCLYLQTPTEGFCEAMLYGISSQDILMM